MRIGSSEAVSSYWTMRLEPTTTIWRTLRGASQDTWMFAVVPLAKVSVMNAVSGTPSWKTVHAEVVTCTTGSSSQYMRIDRSCGARSQTTPSRWYLPRFMRAEVTKYTSPTTPSDSSARTVLTAGL